MIVTMVIVVVVMVVVVVVKKKDDIPVLCFHRFHKKSPCLMTLISEKSKHLAIRLRWLSRTKSQPIKPSNLDPSHFGLISVVAGIRGIE